MLNKESFKALYAEVNGTSKNDAKARVEEFLAALTVAVRDHGGVKLDPLTHIKVVEKKARKGRNPQTGEEIQIAAGRKLHIKQLKGLKDLVK